MTIRKVKDEFVAMLKEEGWKIRKEDDVWIHVCPTCSEGT
jgi:hypothetical protein